MNALAKSGVGDQKLGTGDTPQSSILASRDERDTLWNLEGRALDVWDFSAELSSPIWRLSVLKF